MATFTRQYRPSTLDDVEEIENYCPRGFHPINIEYEIEGRYKVVHKLGHGGFSAVWLARDKLTECYVALKIIVASIRQDCKELGVLQTLLKETTCHPGRNSVISLLDNFMIEGSNVRHVCLVLQVAGPSTTSLNYSPSAVARSQRLRSHLTLKVAKQIVQALGFVQAQGFCRGGLTILNFLFRLNDSINT
ncbi:kinase-like domain-containing protein [Hyaloscypha sp. PMI_1271]|nr:kinase-like domain-containing protein [Hyaloscypha sp. PMI_1271]